MELTEAILSDRRFRQWMEHNASCERERVFCRHDIAHAMDVARVAYIMVLERKIPLEKDVVYAAALLHDIAKWDQYEQGSDHALAGSVLAGELLRKIGADPTTTKAITDAIRTHRVADAADSPLGSILYESDKKCRMCITCPAIAECKRFADGSAPRIEY